VIPETVVLLSMGLERPVRWSLSVSMHGPLYKGIEGSVSGQVGESFFGIVCGGAWTGAGQRGLLARSGRQKISEANRVWHEYCAVISLTTTILSSDPCVVERGCLVDGFCRTREIENEDVNKFDGDIVDGLRGGG